MGCDIHIFLEKYNENKQRWETFDFYEKNDYFIPDTKLGDEEYDGERFIVVEFDDNRWYEKFSILSDGVRGEAPGPYIVKKGFPQDSCPEITAEFKRWDCDAHSPNWCTATEFRHMAAQYRVLRGADSPLTEMHNALDAHIQRKLKWNHIIDAQNMDHIRMVYWFDN